MEDESDELGAHAVVHLDRPDDVPLDDVLHAPAFLVVVPDLQLGSLRGWRGEQRGLDGNQGAEENHGKPHVSWSREELTWQLVGEKEATLGM